MRPTLQRRGRNPAPPRMLNRGRGRRRGRGRWLALTEHTCSDYDHLTLCLEALQRHLMTHKRERERISRVDNMKPSAKKTIIMGLMNHSSPLDVMKEEDGRRKYERKQKNKH